MISSLDIAWLAGIIEGEGWISSSGKSLELGVTMTDKDVMEKVSDLSGKKLYFVKSPRGGKDSWSVRLNGRKAAAWVMTLYTFLGVRRRERAREALTAWYTRPMARRDMVACKNKHPYTPENLHIDKQGHRRCRECNRMWHRNRRARLNGISG